MRREILIESLLGETRLAVIEDGRLCELHIEGPDGSDVAGSIYLGRVESTVPGLNAAFVDIGLERNGFLAAADMPAGAQSGAGRIKKLVHPGETVLVQVDKPQSGQKGHRLTGQITLPGRYLALLPGTRQAAVSKKINEDDERMRLTNVVRALVEKSGIGAIARTAAAHTDAEVLEAEYDRLLAHWEMIRDRSEHTAAPRCLYSNRDLIARCAREMLDGDTDALLVEDRETFESLRSEVSATAPGFLSVMRQNEGRIALFDLYRVDHQLDKALKKHVWLDNGGSLVIEATEAMTVIDVNTGRFTGKRDVEETLYGINCEAATEIVRQLRLRDIGGIIIVDFIDMADPSHREALVERLRELAVTDHNRLTVVGMTGLGLVELTRKKQRRPLALKLLHKCTDCGGEGYVPSHEFIARRILREIWRRRRSGDESVLCVDAAAPVAGWLKKLGPPAGGPVYVRRAEARDDSEYQILPVDASHLPEDCVLLNRSK
ncbi:MAG: Rne/Rng family ribonuclease [Clostridia bacterium]|nr:Rne/Rng family ribonuclease [Clostridia bacterium]